MITFKQAIKAARDLSAEIFDPSDLNGLRVEAISLSDDRAHWYVTLGWVATDTRVLNPSNAFAMPSRPDTVEAPRVYKKFKIDSNSGEMIAMSDGG
jgi:hypothetical protein